MGEEGTHWLYRWMDRHGVKDLARLEPAFMRPSARKELRELAMEEDCSAIADRAIVAGRGLDMGLLAGCTSEPCRRSKVELVLKRAAFYFDQVVLTDTIRHMIRFEPKYDNDDLWQDLVPTADSLLLIREMGAESLVTFADKPHPSPEVSDEIEKLMSAHADGLRDVAQELEFKARENSVEVTHPDSEVFVRYDFDEIGLSDLEDAVGAASHWYLHGHLSYLDGDVTLGRALGLPVALSSPLYRRLLTETAGASGEISDLYFHLELPVLDGIHASDLIRIRENERESFERFRNALTGAVAERARAQNEVDPERISRELEADLIIPRLQDIERGLKDAGRKFAQKAGSRVTFGALVTACGLLSASPQLLTAGVATALSSLPAWDEYREKRQEVEFDDIYFLWNVMKFHGKS